jgi:hypothetical protein
MGIIWYGGGKKNEKQVVVHSAQKSTMANNAPLKDHLGECPWLTWCWWHHIPDYIGWNIKGIQECENN